MRKNLRTLPPAKAQPTGVIRGDGSRSSAHSWVSAFVYLRCSQNLRGCAARAYSSIEGRSRQMRYYEKWKPNLSTEKRAVDLVVGTRGLALQSQPSNRQIFYGTPSDYKGY
jgi:hypothetical protein